MDRTRLDASPESADRDDAQALPDLSRVFRDPVRHTASPHWESTSRSPTALERSLPEMPAGPLAHERRDCHVPKPLPGGEEHLAVAVRNKGPGVEGRWTVEFFGIEAKPPVGLVGEQINAVTDPPRRALEPASEFLQHISGINASGRIMRRIHDYQLRLRPDHRVNRR